MGEPACRTIAPRSLGELLRYLDARFPARELASLGPARGFERPARRVPSGLPELDRLCGGLPVGGIAELIAAAAGGALVLHACLAAAAGRGARAALVDPGEGFDPASARAAGVVLRSLLWVRPRGGRQQAGRRALRAAELILATGRFGLVALDLQGGFPPPRAAAWLRLGRLARSREAVLLLIAEQRLALAAELVVELRCRPRWGDRERLRGGAESATGGGPRWLAGMEPHFVVRKGGRR
ncbi:MAG: hypothetical protein JXR96_10500 [Deltaproteobacteria bacterium]|nr:hypothetical protein [Deltaproteobacteria bacterium]